MALPNAAILTMNHAVAAEADKTDRLGDMAVDPLLVSGSVGVVPFVLADLAFGGAERRQNHALIHAHLGLMEGDGVLQRRGQGLGVGLGGGSWRRSRPRG